MIGRRALHASQEAIRRVVVPGTHREQADGIEERRAGTGAYLGDVQQRLEDGHAFAKYRTIVMVLMSPQNSV